MALRYSILHHTGVASPHFDLLFESGAGEMLRTFRAPCWPIVTPTDLIAAPDHRPIYLTYQGPISGGRGIVRQVQTGTYEIDLPWRPVDQSSIPHVDPYSNAAWGNENPAPPPLVRQLTLDSDQRFTLILNPVLRLIPQLRG
ncbi:MAG: hypothetical protein IT448_01760 [Phycisphaerales bacterium]|nr:hypothetical protein [Phycisphaerales bacterium]